MDRLSRYFRDTIAEMKHVRWPTQNQALMYTAVVIGISLIVMVFVSVADFVFTSGLDFIISHT
jgi:preprotein translocase SecE subunit